MNTTNQKRIFRNRRFKNRDCVLHFAQDDYTDNEMNIGIENICHIDWTMIAKRDLKRFANELKERKKRVFSDYSNYAPNPYFLAEKREDGYFLQSKGLCLFLWIYRSVKWIRLLISLTDYIFK